MDIKNSSVAEEEHNLSYDLCFKDVITKKLKSQGEVDKNSDEASAQFEFELNKEKNIQGIPHNKSLRFFLSYKFSEFQHTAKNPKENKNISLYVRELVGDIEEILGKKMQSEGAAANQQDLKRIHNSEQEKISTKLVPLINISISLANMRLNLEKNEPEEIENSKNQQKKTINKAAKLNEFKLEVMEVKTNTMNET